MNFHSKFQFGAVPRADSPGGALDLDQAAGESSPSPDGLPLPHSCVTLEQLTEHSCRWPMGEPVLFCGRHKKLGVPYCEAHAARAYAGARKPQEWKGEEAEAYLAARRRAHAAFLKRQRQKAVA